MAVACSLDNLWVSGNTPFMLASIVIAGVVFKRLLTLSYLVILSVPEARVIWSYLHLERRTLHLRQAARAIGHAT